MSLGSPDFYKAIVGVANKKSLRTPALSLCHTQTYDQAAQRASKKEVQSAGSSLENFKTFFCTKTFFSYQDLCKIGY